MPGIIFRKCECGRELKIFFQPDSHRQIYTCECKRKGTIEGLVVAMYSSNSNSLPKSETDWVRVPMWKIEDAE